MKAEKLLAEISRSFFAEHHIIRYRTKKVSEMNDDEIITFCHWFCEENNLVNEFKKYRNTIESQYRYCSYLQEYIDDEICSDMQLIINECIPHSKFPNYSIDNEIAAKHCEECKYKMKL